MKISHWIIDTGGLIYGPFKTKEEAAIQAIQHHGYNWAIKPVWKPIK